MPCNSLKSFHTDINECEDDPDSCDENAVCANTDGNYTCSCTTGYSGDGQSCMGMLWGYKILCQVILKMSGDV